MPSSVQWLVSPGGGATVGSPVGLGGIGDGGGGDASVGLGSSGEVGSVGRPVVLVPLGDGAVGDGEPGRGLTDGAIVGVGVARAVGVGERVGPATGGSGATTGPATDRDGASRMMRTWATRNASSGQ